MLSLIAGKRTLRVDDGGLQTVHEIISSGNYASAHITSSDEAYDVTLPFKDALKIGKILKQNSVPYEIIEAKGLPALILKYKKRPGILIGMILFFTVIFLSSRILWNFEITGNENTTDSEIIERLTALGCGYGSYIPDIDVVNVQNDSLLNNETLAWLSVNIDGNVAYVEVSEKRVYPPKYVKNNGKLANVVAAEDGVIETVEVKEGKAQVKRGEVVKEGQLLISGVADVAGKMPEFTHADGTVTATVRRNITKEVFFEQSENVETGRECSDYTIKLFGYNRTVAKHVKTEYNKYNTRNYASRLTLPWGIPLPMFINRVTYAECEERTRTLDRSSALREARNEALTELRSIAGDSQLVSVKENVSENGKSITVTLEAYVITDISSYSMFSADLAGFDNEKDGQ